MQIKVYCGKKIRQFSVINCHPRKVELEQLRRRVGICHFHLLSEVGVWPQWAEKEKTVSDKPRNPDELMYTVLF